MIPDDAVEEVRAGADIVGIVGEVVDLKKSGPEFKGRCPFHDDKTPSFYVVPAKGIYHCFGCGVTGDVFRFVMQRQGLDFVNAVREVGRKSGIAVREVKGKGPQEDPNRPFHEANGFAQAFFVKELWESDRGSVARAYLEKRGIARDVAERFGLGCAPDAWDSLKQAAATHGLDESVLLEVGLLKENEQRTEVYDRWRDRLMFPIESTGGKVVGFGGRQLNEKTKGGKYMNSPETPVYHKSEILYGLSRAKNEIRKASTALVVEGYMDVVSLAAVGVANVVAVLGTSLTSKHAELLRRYTSRVTLLFDSDLAGLKATFRAGDALLSQGLQPSVVTFPAGEDPDSIVRAGGASALKPYLDGAVDVLDRKIQILESKDYFSDTQKKRRALDRLLPTLRAVADPTLRELYVARVAERLGIRPESIDRELAAPQATRTAVVVPAPSRTPSRPTQGRATRNMGAERQLLHLLTRDRPLIERARNELRPDEFMNQHWRAVYELLLSQPELRHAPPDLDVHVAGRLNELLEDDTEVGEANRVFSESVEHMRDGAVHRRLQALDAEMAEARKQGDESRAQTLLVEKERLSRARAEPGTRVDWRRAVNTTLKNAQHGLERETGG